MSPKIFPASLLALTGSAMLSLWMFFGEPSVNTDGVIYLNTARAFLDKGFTGALDVYGWPFYSILIALVSKLGFSLAQSAALLNVVFFATLAWAFVATTELLHPGRRVIHYVAAAVILFEPYINSLRDSFFRDNGQMACMLISLLALLHYTINRRPLALLIWALSAVAATLFRPEAVLLLPAGIIALGVDSGRKKTMLLGLALLFAVATASILLLQHYAPTSRVRDLLTWANYYLSEFGSTFSSKATMLEKNVLGEFSNNGREALLASLLVTLLAAVIGVLSPIYALILWLQRQLDTGLLPSHRRVLVAYTIATLIPSVFFVAYAYFVSQRYVLTLVLVLLLLVAPRLLRAIASIRSRLLRTVVAALLILFFAISSYRNLRIETELKDAGLWLAQQSGSVWTNSIPIAYYVSTLSNTATTQIQNQSIAQTDLSTVNANWVAIVVAKRDAAQIPQLLIQLNGVEKKRFAGGGRFVVVIKR